MGSWGPRRSQNKVLYPFKPILQVHCHTLGIRGIMSTCNGPLIKKGEEPLVYKKLFFVIVLETKKGTHEQV